MVDTATATLEGPPQALTPDSAPAAESTPSTPASAATTDKGKRDEPRVGREDHERRVFEALDEGKSIAEARKAALDPEPGEAVADPPRAAAQREDNQTRGEKPPASSTSTRVTDAPTTATHDGLDALSRQALSQTHLLPDAEVWNRMSGTQRENAMAAAKELLAHRSREYQRNNGNGKAPARDAQGRFAPQTTPENGNDPQVQDDPADQQSRAGRQPPQQAVTPSRDDRTGAEQSRAQQPQLPKRLMDLTESLGEEIGRPLLEGLTELDSAHRQETAQLRQQLDMIQQAGHQQVQAQLNREEQTTRTELAAQLPSLATDEAKWSRVKENATVLAQVQYQTNRTWDWGQCLKSAATFLFNSDIQQEAQRALAGKRQNALRGTPERGTQQSRPESAASKDEWDALALERLENGETADDVRRARMAG